MFSKTPWAFLLNVRLLTLADRGFLAMPLSSLVHIFQTLMSSSPATKSHSFPHASNFSHTSFFCLKCLLYTYLPTTSSSLTLSKHLSFTHLLDPPSTKMLILKSALWNHHHSALCHFHLCICTVNSDQHNSRGYTLAWVWFVSALRVFSMFSESVCVLSKATVSHSSVGFVYVQCN